MHLTSPDLAKWRCESAVDLGTSSVIDPSVMKVGQGYRMWYKHDRFGSKIVAADSTDFLHWTKVGALRRSALPAARSAAFRPAHLSPDDR